MKAETFVSWYTAMQAFARSGKCGDGAWDGVRSMVPPEKFMGCLGTFLNDPFGIQYRADLLWSEDGSIIVGFRQSVQAIKIESIAVDGVNFLLDMRMITDQGPLNTFSFNMRYFDFESYVIFSRETILNVAVALVVVCTVIFTLTANLTVTLFVFLCVALVDYFLFSLMSFWGIALNSISVINIILAIGLAVDYSAHIGHAYLMVDPP